MSDRKPIYCPNLPEILTQLQGEFPWVDSGTENQHIIFAWGQDHGFEKLDFEIVRAAVHNLGKSALDFRKDPPAPVTPPPAPEPAIVRQPRHNWNQYVKSGAAIPLKAPDGTACPPEVLQRCSAKQVRDYVRAEEKEKKPWLSDFTDKGSQFRR
jgi:hypothetical protein